MIITATAIKHIENGFKILNESQIDLDSILFEEFESEFPSDIYAGF
jgi:hypothetical protein